MDRHGTPDPHGAAEQPRAGEQPRAAEQPGAAGSPGAADPSEHSLWRPLRLLQTGMDADIGRVYAEAQVEGLKPSFVLELLRLHARGPMTITELAASVQRTHSAISQKVAAMRAAGLVATIAGTDARSKTVVLTDRARAIAGLLAAEWQATEAAVAELEAEIPYPLSRVVTDLQQALQRKSFHDRIAEKLAADPAWSAGARAVAAGETGHVQPARAPGRSGRAGHPGSVADAAPRTREMGR
jgi:DNA-binding MarR family transcriptional regulator